MSLGSEVIKFSGATNPYLYGVIRGAKESATVTNDYAGYLAFYTQAASSVTDERMRISSTGNVGIGITPNANTRLSIAGLATSTASLTTGDIWVDTTGGLNILKIVEDCNACESASSN